MNPIAHLLVSWTVAETAPLERRDRAIVTLAGVVPDADGLGILVELPTKNTEHPLYWWSEYHHTLGHNLTLAAIVGVTALALSQRRLMTASLAFVTFHLHLACDLVGARGPDGFQWPIPYLYPFSDEVQWTWSGQWELNAWPNVAIGAVLLGVTLYLAWRRGYSPLEMVSETADRVFVETVRDRFPLPSEAEAEGPDGSAGGHSRSPD